MMTNKTSRAFQLGVAAVVGVAMSGIGCAGNEAGEPAGTADESVSAVVAATTDDGIESVIRDVESGRNLEQARVRLEQVLQDPASTSDQRDDARLALSRVHELLGDKEAAIRVVEELLASHSIEVRFAARELAAKRLRMLLTGSDEDAPRLPAEDDVAPVAEALSQFFAAGADGSTDINLLLFGRTSEDDGSKATFNISGALQKKQREACPLCSDASNLHTSRSQVSSWVSLPATLGSDSTRTPTFGSALTVFYYDLETNRIPSRYDAYLPLPSKEIAAHLEKGEGLFAVKIREGAPPVIVIAAPRWAQLSEVEKALGDMKTLPTEPTVVPLKPNARPKEIQAVVRASFGKMRQCYETHLASVPDAQGKISMAFTINPDGSVGDLDASESTLTDATLQGCFKAVFADLKFPATGRTTTVKYPIALTP